MPFLPSVRENYPRLQKPNLYRRLARPAEVVDTLVFMLAGMLIPAWLLGHLFLTFYPAPEGTIEDLAIASTSFTGESSDPDSGDSVLASSNLTGGDSEKVGESDEHQNANVGTANFNLEELTQKTESLETEIASLKQENKQLATASTSLKSATNTPADAEALEQLNELREQLRTSNESLSVAEKQFNNTEAERLQLSSKLSELQTEFDRAKSDLAAARSTPSLMAPVESTDSSPFSLVPDDENQSQNAELIEEVRTAKATVSQLQSNVATLEQDLRTMTDALSVRDSELQSMRMALEETRTSNSNLKFELTEARQQIIKLEMPKEVYRDFVSSKGSISKMAFIRWEDENVIVRSFADKRLYRLTLDRFSEADQQYLLERKSSPNN